MKSSLSANRRVRWSLLVSTCLLFGRCLLAQDQTVTGNLLVTDDAGVSGDVIVTGDVEASHVVSASAQGSSAFYGNQVGNTFGNLQPIYAAVSDNPNGNQNWFFRGTVGGSSGTETFYIRADGQIRSAVLAGSGMGLVSVDSNGVLSRSASIVSNGGNVGIGTDSPADTLTANGSIRALASNNGGFMAYDSPSGGNHVFSLVRGNGSNNLDISAYDGIGFATNATTGPATNYSMFIASNGNVGIGTSTPNAALQIVGTGVSSGNSKSNIVIITPSTYIGEVTGGRYGLQFLADNDRHAGIYHVAETSYFTQGGLAFEVSGQGIPQREVMRIASQSGNVGIGTTSPAAKLQIQGANVWDSTAALNLINGSSDYGRTTLRLTGRMQDGNEGWSPPGGGRNSLVFAANTTASGANVGALGVDKFALQYNMLSDELGFVAQDSNVRLSINQAGNVGIGTTGSAAKLDVNGNQIVRGNIKNFGTDENWSENMVLIKSSGWGGVRFARNDPVSGNFEGNWAIGYNAGTGNDLSISTNRSGVQYDGIIHISNITRNVGIGTTTPAAKLDVAGDVNVQGNLTVNGNFIAPNGAVSGSANGLAINAGGANQNITLAPSGGGRTVTAAPVAITSSAASISPATGALTVSGGAGVTGDVNVGGGITSGTSTLAISNVGAYTSRPFIFNSVANQPVVIAQGRRLSGRYTLQTEYNGPHDTVLDVIGSQYAGGQISVLRDFRYNGTVELSSFRILSSADGSTIQLVADAAHTASFICSYEGSYSSDNLQLPPAVSIPQPNLVSNKAYVVDTDLDVESANIRSNLTVGGKYGADGVRSALSFGSNYGAFGNPGGVYQDSNGDKLVLYNAQSGAVFDARIGVGETGNMWFKAGYAGGTAAHYEWYTSTGSGTAIARVMDLGNSGLNIQSATASTSPSTGALVVAGGAGIAGNLNVAGVATVKTKLRIPPSGDLSMGGFTAGTNPAAQ